MTPVWLNSDTGELYEGGECPSCAQVRTECDQILSANERDQRVWKLRATRAETKLEAQTATRRDKAEWQRILDTWLLVFPDEPKLRSTSVKSARATEYFARTDTGAFEADVVNAIHGARVRPYLRYGRRVEKRGPETERAVDIADVVKTSGTYADANFDLLCAIGAFSRAAT